MKQTVWFICYAWESRGGGLNYENELSTEHPFLVFAKWQKLDSGNNRARLISFQEVEVADDIKKYVEYTLGGNMGEMHGMEEDE